MADTTQMPTIKLTISASDGVKPEQTVGTPIIVQVPKQLSLRIAKMYLIEYLAKELKGEKITEALKAIGCK